jgi:sulfate transport system ATP-binding protein
MSVVVEGLTRRYPSAHTPAVADVSFAAPTGSITSLLGPSGSGKSTVLRLIAGLDRPDTGRVCFGDEDVTALPPQRRGVGFVFQNYALFRHMTVRDNVAFGLDVRGVARDEIDARVGELLALVQLTGYSDRYPAQLSGGQRQRVAFARALAVQPKVLLLDEPFGALDTRVRIELREWLLRIHEQTHLTTILVTHDQDEALELSEHIVVMKDGRVVQTGTPREVYDRPASPFVAEFVGNASVLSGRVHRGRADLAASVSVDAPVATPEGAAVRAFVRPHEVKLRKATDGHIAPAKIERAVIVGSRVKVSVRLTDGSLVTVDLSRDEHDALGCREGDGVMVDLHDAKLFVEDYAI